MDLNKTLLQVLVPCSAFTTNMILLVRYHMGLRVSTLITMNSTSESCDTIIRAIGDTAESTIKRALSRKHH